MVGAVLIEAGEDLVAEFLADPDIRTRRDFEDFGVLRLPRIAYSVNAANSRSVRLMRRLGFRQVSNLHPTGADSFLGVLDNGLTQLSVDSYVRELLVGAIIIGAVWASRVARGA